MVCNFRKRLENHKKSDQDKINKINCFIGKRISTKSSCMSYKKMDEEFSNKTQFYKQFSRKFRLPDIEKQGSKLVKISMSLAKVDTSIFSRKYVDFKLNTVGDTINVVTEGLCKSPVSSLHKHGNDNSHLNQIKETNFLKFKSRFIIYNVIFLLNRINKIQTKNSNRTKTRQIKMIICSLQFSKFN